MDIIALLPGSKYTFDVYNGFDKSNCRVFEDSDLQIIRDDTTTIVKNADITSLVRQYNRLPPPKSLIVIYPDIAERVAVLTEHGNLNSINGTFWEDLINLQNGNRKEISLVSYSQVFLSQNKASTYFKRDDLFFQLDNSGKRLAKLEYLLYSYLTNTNPKLSILRSRLQNSSVSLLEEEFASESIQQIFEGISEYEDKLNKSRVESTRLKTSNLSLLEEKNGLVKNMEVLKNQNCKHISEKNHFLKQLNNDHKKKLSLVKNSNEQLLHTKNKYEKKVTEIERKYQKEKIGCEKQLDNFHKEKISYEKQLASLKENAFQATIKVNTFQLNQYYESSSNLLVFVKKMLNKFRLFIPSQRRKHQIVKNAHFLLESGYFDTERYYELYPDVKESGSIAVLHYLRYGYKEGRSPSQQFDPIKYLKANKDVADEGVNPLLHYLTFGRYEGRPLEKIVKEKV